MTSSRDRRVAKELLDIQADREQSGVYAVPVDGSNLKHLKGTISGPPDTPYVGGTFTIDIQIPDNYPFKPPKMRFETKIWHPNVSSQTGSICLDTLTSAWSPVQTIKTALLSVRMLLEVPNPKDPQDAEVATMLMLNGVQFAQVAQQWAIKYAGAEMTELDLSKWKESPPPESKKSIADRYMGYHPGMMEAFVEMGFDVDVVVQAFIRVGIQRNNGQWFQLGPDNIGDITASLCGEN
ncbi:hypothetical protein E4U43_003802 [Claviceps pusilla]|uniref:Ubiquitin-conjugating enzyme E2 2 n=1 Tax=Claviceps pusilla TaxID=123648 RepID=A0A9P7SXG6_9HYPO|nr:hypothetical protein E4U43_003802 [Claviceps pusilla]